MSELPYYTMMTFGVFAWVVIAGVLLAVAIGIVALLATLSNRKDRDNS